MGGVGESRPVTVGRLGPMLGESWHIKRSLGDGVTNAMIDDSYDTSKAAGAAGGKILAARGGGFLMFCAPPVEATLTEN